MSSATWIYRPKSDEERELVDRAVKERDYPSYAQFVRDACIAFAMNPNDSLAEIQAATEKAWELVAQLREAAKSHSEISGGENDDD